MVVKNDGTREPFDRDKLMRSVRLPLQKRPVDAETMERCVNQIVRELEQGGDADATTKLIGEKVMQALAKLDPVAYVRYASIYKDFREVNDYNAFLATIEEIAKKAGNG